MFYFVSKMVKIKVLLATFNGEQYVIEQITSILKQLSVLVDISICDDGSKDNTVKIINSCFPDISVVVNNPGTGSAANNFLNMIRNLNFDEDFGYVSFADQDDIWLPEKLNNAVKSLLKNKASLYCSNLTKWDMATNTYSELKKDFPQKDFDFLFEGGSAGCTYVFTREFAGELKKFLYHVDSSNWKDFSHDWLVYFFARSRNYNVFIDKSSNILYRIHSQNVHGHLNTLSWNTIKEKTSKVLSGYYQEHAKNYLQFLDINSEEYKIYSSFLKNYISRNLMILKYRNRLMRDDKKLIVFTLLNLLKIK